MELLSQDYLYNMGFARPDGYHRITAWVDTDVRGNLEWTAGLFFIDHRRLSTGWA